MGGWGVALYAVTSPSIRNLYQASYVLAQNGANKKVASLFVVLKMLGTILTPLPSFSSTPFLLHSCSLQQCTKLNSCLNCK